MRSNGKRGRPNGFPRAFAGLKARLRDDAIGSYCHGDTVTIADICLVGLDAGAKAFGIDVSETPTVDRIVAHCQAHPAFAQAAAARQTDYPG